MSCCITNSCGPCKNALPLSQDIKTCFATAPSPSQLIQMNAQTTGNKVQASSGNIKKLQAAFLKGVKWPDNSTIKIAFVKDQNYTEANAKWTQETVEKYLVPLINLKFQWGVPIQGSHIRITFNPRGGAWSYLGTQNLSIPVVKETMNLGWLDMPGEKGTGLGTVVIHEFGHMLGMIHEHSRADADLPWNCEAVYKSLAGPPNNWDKKKVDDNVFQQITEEQFNGSKYDPNSIMHYYFDPSYFCGNVNLPKNTSLSNLDKIWLQRMYPRADNPPPPDDGEGTTEDDEGTEQSGSTSVIDIITGKGSTSTKTISYVLWGIGAVAVIALLWYMWGGGEKKKQVLESKPIVVDEEPTYVPPPPPRRVPRYEPEYIPPPPPRRVPRYEPEYIPPPPPRRVPRYEPEYEPPVRKQPVQQEEGLASYLSPLS
jgi:hypothetical protein